MINTVSILIILIFFGYPVFASHKADTALIRSHLIALTKTDGYRNHSNVALLDKTAEYIYYNFSRYADTTYYQVYEVNGKFYRNVIGSFGIRNNDRIIIGAHYDVCGNQEGADDNASGVVGLLELARLLANEKLANRIDLVAYTLEEPPYFRTEYMGSYVHAKSLAEANISIRGMISLEMIGYFSDVRKSQTYPIGLLSLFYGKRGNYITLVTKFGKGKFARQFSRKFKHERAIRTKSFAGPKSLPGIDFSDHLNYWKFGFSALMITDTSFYRNKNYHEKSDTIETLDIVRMAKVIDGVKEALKKLE